MSGERMGKAIVRLLGGRPMKRVCYCFKDVVNGLPVYLWLDKLGNYWLANFSWSLFRVQSEHYEAWIGQREVIGDAALAALDRERLARWEKV